MTTYGTRANQPKHFIYRLTPTDPTMLTRMQTPPESMAVAEHFQYLNQLRAIGRLVLAGRTANDDKTAFELVIFEADSEEDARRIMGNDPAIQEGVMVGELFPFRIAVERRSDVAAKT